MSNSGFLWTDAGLAARSVAAPGGPYITFNSFRIGSGFGYAPSRSQASMTGSTLYTGTPSTYTLVDSDGDGIADTVDVVLTMDISIGDFNFGEISLYDDTNTMLAICVFDTLQQKIRAIGNQAGNRYRIHSRLKLAQATAVVQVTVSQPMAMLEVPAWTSLSAPVNQLNGANAAIVHESNVSGDSVLVVRDSDYAWACIGYKKIFDGFTTDSGASATNSTLTHTGLGSVYLNLPQTVSRYLIKFSTGDIRKVVSQTGVTNVTWSPALSYTPTGEVTIWEDEATAGTADIPIASMADYNKLAADFNRFWSTPSGAYSTTNAGINQVAIPTLTNRPTLADWTLLSSSLRKLMTLQNYTTTQISAVLDSDWIVHTANQNTTGLYLTNREFDNIYNNIETNLDGTRNTVNVAYLESSVISSCARSRTLPWLSSIEYDFNLKQPNENTRKGIANAGAMITITPTSGNQTTFFAAWQTLYNQIGSIVIDRGTTYSSNTFGTGTSIGLANLTTTKSQIYQASRVDGTLSATLTLTVQAQLDGVGGYNIFMTFAFSGSPYSTPDPGTMSIAVSARRPVTTLINNPAFAYPTGTQLGTSTF
jgi:hypothetical protein